MPVYRLPPEPVFPHPELAREDGLLAVGGDLSPQRLLLAYSHGIFPWPVEGWPLLWFSPDPRTVLAPDELHVPRRLGRTLRQGRFELALDTAFGEVIAACAEVPRPDGQGTWITDEMRAAFVRLHELGFAHSCEAWRDGELVGGVYGVSVGAAFTGESMFYRVSDASKAALVTLVRQLARWGFRLFDAQVPSELIHRLGAEDQPREEFLEELAAAVGEETRRGPWRLDADLAGGGEGTG